MAALLSQRYWSSLGLVFGESDDWTARVNGVLPAAITSYRRSGYVQGHVTFVRG
jgi:hypothetical protein